MTHTVYYDEDRSRVKEIYTVKEQGSNVLEGKYISYYFNGGMESQGYFSNNEPSGEWKFYFENGNLNMEMEVTGSDRGYWIYYFESGEKHMEGEIHNKKREGPWKIYFESGELKAEGNFSANRMTGPWTFYYEDGSLRGEIDYEDHRGVYTEYYNSGELKATGSKFGLTNTGGWIYYYRTPAGGEPVKQAEGNYVNGRKSGEWQYYFPSGDISAVGMYHAGAAHGDWTYYYQDGTVNSTGGFADGQKNGNWVYFYDNGKKLADARYINGTGPYVEYYPSGQEKKRGQFKDGKREGEWEYFYPDGELEGQCTFSAGTGTYEGYHKGTRILKTRGTIREGRRVGTWEIYDEEGELTGYYKPFYSESEISEELMEFRPPRQPDIPEVQFDPSERKFSYFVPSTNEFHGIIVASNPLFLFVGRLPVNLEFYVQERLGHEFEFEAVRDPFFVRDANVELNEVYQRGYSLAIRQKFYNETENPGLWYFGHELQFANIAHNANVVLPSLPDQVVKINAAEQNVFYHLIFGYRLMTDTRKPGFTIDAFTGVGMGYRNFTVVDEYSESFLALPQNPFPVSFRFGLNIGNVFPFGGLR